MGDSQGPSKLVARPPSRPLISLPTLGLNFRCPSERATSLEREGRGSICAQSVKSTHCIILIVGCRLDPS